MVKVTKTKLTYNSLNFKTREVLKREEMTLYEGNNEEFAHELIIVNKIHAEGYGSHYNVEILQDYDEMSLINRLYILNGAETLIFKKCLL